MMTIEEMEAVVAKDSPFVIHTDNGQEFGVPSGGLLQLAPRQCKSRSLMIYRSDKGTFLPIYVEEITKIEFLAQPAAA